MSSYQQVLAGTSLTVTEMFSVDGSPVDLDSGVGTLALTKPDGTSYTPLPTVTHVGAVGSGQYRFVLPAQPDPFWLDYTLTGNIGGQAQTLRGRVEWIGDYLFTLAEMRKLKVAGGTPFSDPAPSGGASPYTNAMIQDTRAEVLDEFCQILNFSPVPRFYRETMSVTSWAGVVLKELKAAKLLSVSVNGVASATSGYYLAPDGSVLPRSAYVAVPWSAYGLGNVSVEYVAGENRVPGRGRASAMLMAGQALNPAGFSSASSVSLPTGESYSYEPAEMGRWGYERHTGVKDLDRWLNRWAAARAGVG